MTPFPAFRPRPRSLALCALALSIGAAVPALAAASDWVGDRHSAVRLVTATDGRGASPLEAGLEFRFGSGWHGYWRTPGDAGVPPAIDWSGTPGLEGATVAWPAPSRLVVSGLQNAVYDGHVLLPVTLAFPPGTGAREIRVAVDYAACANVCVPVHADLSLPLSEGAVLASPEAPLIGEARAAVPGSAAGIGIEVLRREIVGSGAERRLVVDLASTAAPFAHPDLFVEGFGDGLPPAPAVALADGGRTATLTVPLPQSPADATSEETATTLDLTLVDGDRAARFAGPAAAPAPARSGAGGPLLAFLSALLGGLILNLMPCVLPVLSLKLVGLARHVGEGRRAARIGLAASGLGIVTSFLALAAALVALKASGAAVGWGIQFQQPAFLGLMAALTVLFAASLFDWIHIGIPSAAAGLGGRGPRHAWVQSFLTGAFATLLATPCSAPFVGTAVGFALARGPSDVLGIFLCLGVGMALPFFAAALVPGVAGWLPRPGPWMITLRRVLGLMLLATAAWLVAVLDGVAGLPAAGAVALLLAALLVLLGWARRRPRPEGRSWVGAAGGGLVASAVVAAVAVPSLGGGPADGTDGGLAFDPAAIGRIVADGGTVLVDVSARWCLTCKVNELAALKTATVAKRLAEPGTVVMRADWTRPDAAIGRYIQSFARYGIPLDVVYGPRRPAGEALPELLTPMAVVEALDRASAAGERAEASPVSDAALQGTMMPPGLRGAVASHGKAVPNGSSRGRTMGSASAEPDPIDAAWSGLMAAAQAGDRAAYGRLLRECTPLIRRVVRRGLAPDRVDDVVQDVLLTIHRARHTYDPARSFSAWVVTISRRRAVDLLRNRGRHDRREVHAPVAYEGFADEAVDPERDALLDRHGPSLEAALSSLPPRQREAIEALALRQMSLDEAADATGNSKGALKVSLHRALKSLRQRFGGVE